MDIYFLFYVLLFQFIINQLITELPLSLPLREFHGSSWEGCWSVPSWAQLIFLIPSSPVMSLVTTPKKEQFVSTDVPFPQM